MEQRVAEARDALLRHIRKENRAVDPKRLVELLMADGYSRREVQAALHLAMSRNQIRIDREMRFFRPGKTLQAA